MPYRRNPHPGGPRALPLLFASQATVIEKVATGAEPDAPPARPGTQNGPAVRGRQSGRWWTRTTDLFLIREAL